MNFTNSSVFIVTLIVILVIIYIGQNNLDNFDPNLSQSYQSVNYNTLEQDCNQLTWNPSKCKINTVIPSNVNVCNNELTPVTNNEKECKKKKKYLKKRPTVSLQYDFDLLSSFNNAQINNSPNQNPNNQNVNNQNINNDNELLTDIRSLNSLENDLISNY
jgi:hypothetical protein